MENNNKNEPFLEIPDPEMHLIPYYDEILSVGNADKLTLNGDKIPPPTDFIDTGDLFRDATSAIRHYGANMAEYPNGCIIALKEIQNIQSIIWGQDYVIETNQYRLAGKLQKSAHPNHLTAYSTNPSTHPDGQTIHEPVEIPVESIRTISLVLGYVVKQCGGCNNAGAKLEKFSEPQPQVDEFL